MRAPFYTLLTTAFTLALIHLLSSTALALREGDPARVTDRRESDAGTTEAPGIRVEGELSCTYGSQNSGAACELKLRDEGNGRFYRLSNGYEAMRLFQSGKRRVAVQGALASVDTIEVETVTSR